MMMMMLSCFDNKCVILLQRVQCSNKDNGKKKQ